MREVGATVVEGVVFGASSGGTEQTWITLNGAADGCVIMVPKEWRRSNHAGSSNYFL